MLGGTNLILAHVGGGDKDDADRLSSHARNCGG